MLTLRQISQRSLREEMIFTIAPKTPNPKARIPKEAIQGLTAPLRRGSDVFLSDVLRLFLFALLFALLFDVFFSPFFFALQCGIHATKPSPSFGSHIHIGRRQNVLTDCAAALSGKTTHLPANSRISQIPLYAGEGRRFL